MFSKKKQKIEKFYCFPSPSDPSILYGSTDPKEAAELAHGMKLWKDVATGKAKDIYGVPDGAKKSKKKKKK